MPAFEGDMRETIDTARNQAARARRAALAVTLPQLRELFLAYASRCDAEADQLDRGSVH